MNHYREPGAQSIVICSFFNIDRYLFVTHVLPNHNSYIFFAATIPATTVPRTAHSRKNEGLYPTAFA